MKKGIVLGLFNTQSFHDYAEKEENSPYPFRKNNVINQSDWFDGNTVLDVVLYALKNCDICYFILDGMELPITFNRDGYTNKELKLVLDNPIFYTKTIFIKDKAIYELEDVLKLIKQ